MTMETSGMNFGQALDHLNGMPNNMVTRKAWKGSNGVPLVKLQLPDENSKMTEPYLYMEKKIAGKLKRVRFPLDLSCESILAKDWEIFI